MALRWGGESLTTRIVDTAAAGCRVVSDDVAGPHPDGGDEAETGSVALVFALATPVAVLVVGTCELTTRAIHLTAATHVAGSGLAALTRLRALGWWWEEQVREPTTGCIVHPSIIRDDSLYEKVDRSH